MMPVDAKPWRANRSAMVLLTSSCKGLGRRRAGLFRRQPLPQRKDNESSSASEKAHNPLRKARKRGAARVDPSALLRWYDRHRRILPWPRPQGERADPYRVWLSEIIAAADHGESGCALLCALPRSVPDRHRPRRRAARRRAQFVGRAWLLRARAQSACLRPSGRRATRRRISRYRGCIAAAARNRPYTAAAIASIAFDRRASPVDGNIERVDRAPLCD